MMNSFKLPRQLKSYLNKESILGVEEIKVDVNKSKPGLAIQYRSKKIWCTWSCWGANWTAIKTFYLWRKIRDF
jgi:hypothetical protein